MDTPTADRAEFQQFIPAEGVWTLVEGDKFTSRLVYENEAGERILVPNAWGNQPPAWRADYFAWLAERKRERLDKLRASASTDLDQHDIEKQEQLVAQCEQLAADYRAKIATSNVVEAEG